MNLMLDFHIEPSNIQLTYRDSITLIGSCFSDEIGQMAEKSGFDTEINPFGTLFHPLAISNVIKSSIRQSEEVNIYQREDVFFSWDAASKLFAYSSEEIKRLILRRRIALRERLVKSKLLVLTFGTAWAYQHNELKTIVGNCHKAPQSNFKKELSSIDEMVKAWREVLSDLRQLNPSLNVVFTVSPVRHVKDGLTENNRSKARLLELVHELVGKNVDYFPSYEIVIDQLRDYRFYTKDLIHPSEEAIQFIWSRFKEFSFATETCGICNEQEKIRVGLNHVAFHAESRAEKQRAQRLMEQLEKFKKKYPFVLWH